MRLQWDLKLGRTALRSSAGGCCAAGSTSDHQSFPGLLAGAELQGGEGETEHAGVEVFSLCPPAS